MLYRQFWIAALMISARRTHHLQFLRCLRCLQTNSIKFARALGRAGVHGANLMPRGIDWRNGGCFWAKEFCLLRPEGGAEGERKRGNKTDVKIDLKDDRRVEAQHPTSTLSPSKTLWKRPLISFVSFFFDFLLYLPLPPFFSHPRLVFMFLFLFSLRFIISIFVIF